MGDPLVEGVRLAMGIGLLSFAALKDLRTRIVPDYVWMVMGTVGFVLMVYELLIPEFSWPLLAAIVGVYLVLLDFLIPRPEIFPKDGKPNPLAAIMPIAGWGMLIAAAAIALEDAIAPVMSGCIIAFAYVMYRLGYIAGGADAKALMAISVLVPLMPSTETFPVIPAPEGAFNLFPFVILAFIYSGLLHVTLLPYYGVRNALKGDLRFPQMFIGHRMNVDKVRGSFVWSLERLEGGAPVVGLRHVEEEDFDPAAFRRAGVGKVWVTPQHPGIMFLLVGFMLAFLVGNPFLLLVG